MKYSELVRFEPIETVIQINQADEADAARRLVETYVLSEGMARQLNDRVFPNLQFDAPADNKGVLVVGNYGTGKSHLLSFLSAIAESEAMLEAARNRKAIPEARRVAGRFKVARLEIGSTRKSLRDIICGKLEDYLGGVGVSYSFPAAEKVPSNKDALVEMMGWFASRHPDHGLMLVVDELLDYLRSRNEQELILDLGFLREVGEVCKLLRFRFIAGLQETLFDNYKFQFAAQSLLRVRDRFESMRIVREDVAHVVAERLLAKTDRQKGKIREHLQKFTPLYGNIAERLEEFVRLFPIHPTFLEVFEDLSIAEKREVLKTLSRQMKLCIDKQVPADQPGVISYDAYWEELKDNPAVRSIPDVRQVMEKSQDVESRVQQAFTKPAYKPMALRIIRALAVHRLSTDDISARIGPNVEELRDGLCLYLNLPEKTSDFLKTTVEACLREIMKTMSGQYITHNPENDQYFLDLQKVIDYDAKIQDRADTLADHQLDRYYFDALTRVMECADQTYVREYRIWEHEVEWQGHKVTRRGYLFFGAPNERSTAQPPRDFYLYFLQPFEPPAYEDQQRSDEVFFKLAHHDDAFLRSLRLYAGAREMAAASTSGHRKVYEEKADIHLRALVAWLRKHMLTAYEVAYRGVSKKLVEWLKGQRTGDAAVRDLIDLTGSAVLSPYFQETYPDYPSFSVRLTTSNLRSAVEDAVRCLAGGTRNQLAGAVLDGLELIEEERVRPLHSRYARAVVEKLDGKPAGQVLSRKELIVARNGTDIEAQFKLEPELLVVVLLALVQNGNLTLSLAGSKKLDAGNLAEAARTALDQLVQFKHVERPTGFPLAEWAAVMDLLGLPEGLVRNPDAREQAVLQLRPKVSELTERVVLARQHAQSGLPVWGGELLSSETREAYQKPLNDLQAFLEKLQPFNSVGKMNNLRVSLAEIQAQRDHLARVKELDDLQALIQELNPLTGYLSTASAVLPPGDPWRSQQETLKAQWQGRLLDPAQRSASDFRAKILRALQEAKEGYKTHLIKLHQKARLNSAEDSKKKGLLRDSRLERLQKLQGVSLLSHAALGELQERLTRLKPCFALVRDDLDASPICPHCGFRPLEESNPVSGMTVLGQIDTQLDTLTDNWTRTLLDNLADPTAQESIELLPAGQKRAVTGFIKARELPDRISNDLVQGIQSALAGLSALTVAPADLLAKLGEGGAPCTVEQFRQRFEEFVEKLLFGKDQDRVRILVQKPDAGGGQP